MNIDKSELKNDIRKQQEEILDLAVNEKDPIVRKQLMEKFHKLSEQIPLKDRIKDVIKLVRNEMPEHSVCADMLQAKIDDGSIK